ncbi:MAG: PAS domain-containing protein, partial [Spirochaetales bacterium]|nr:PAS domain-containing protein [Spirochaetales bacterium]
MSRFIKKALEKLPRLDKGQLGELLKDIVAEHQLYEASLQSIPGGLVVLSSDNNVLFHNKAAERFLGLSTSVETSEKPIWNLPVDREVAEYFRQTLTSTEPMFSREFTFDAPNG